MSVEPIGFLPAVASAAQPDLAATAAAQPATAGFGDWSVRGMQDEQPAHRLAGRVAGLALGEAQNLHQVMIRLEDTGSPSSCWCRCATGCSRSTRKSCGCKSRSDDVAEKKNWWMGLEGERAGLRWVPSRSWP